MIEENKKSNQTLGEIIKEKRQSLRIDISTIAAYLKVKQSDILAIEEERFEEATKHLYIPGLIRSYAKFLHIPDDILEEKILLLPIRHDLKNSKHELINLEKDEILSPSRDCFFNSLLIFILLFLVLLSVYNFHEKNANLISNNDLVKELVKIKF
jgi:cytoskeletal protein RodZ